MIRTIHHAVLGLALSAATLPTGVAAKPAGPPARVLLADFFLYRSPNPAVGGSKMEFRQSIAQNLARSRDHTTFTQTLQAAGLRTVLEGKGPFTVFAPSDAAFAALPPGRLRTLLKPRNQPELARLLRYHVVAGSLSSDYLKERVGEGWTVGVDHFGNHTELTTLAGEKLVVSLSEDGRHLLIKDARGSIARITVADVRQANGVFHVVDRVLMP